MNTGKNIVELAQEVLRRAQTANDYVVSTEKMHVDPSLNGLVIDGIDNALSITKHAHNQIAKWADIPSKYYQRMLLESPQLLADNVNHWFQDEPRERMIRTLDGKARAFLSNSYRRIDNHHILETALPALTDIPGTEIVSADVTDTRLYLKCLFTRTQGEVKKDDIVEAGVMVSNSEVGLGKLNVLPFVHRLACTNGMVVNDAGKYGLTKQHIGRRITSEDESFTIYRSETIQADDKALMMKLQDTLRSIASPKVFNDILAKLRRATESVKVQDPERTAMLLAKTYDLNDAERFSFLENLIRDRDYSQYGALNAVTHIANTLTDYDRSTELETTGGRILDLTPGQWQRLAEAA